MMITISVRVEPRQLEVLKKMAIKESVKRGVSVLYASLVREAIEAYIANKESN